MTQISFNNLKYSNISYKTYIGMNKEASRNLEGLIKKVSETRLPTNQ